MTQTSTIESRIDDLLAQMTLEEKIGQMWQISGKIDGAEEHPSRRRGIVPQRRRRHGARVAAHRRRRVAAGHSTDLRPRA
ncbi:MAG: hypothetical protein R2873_05030 [Caldilineaceae bacterium]